MSTYQFGFIGTGNMGSSIARAVCRAINPKEVVLSNKTAKKATALAYELNCAFSDSLTVAREAKFIFLGVKPQNFKELLENIAPILKEREDHFVLISMAAGITLSSIKNYLNANYAIIRIMPNTPVAIGQGMTVYTVNENVYEDDISEFCNAMRCSGEIDRISENLIDAECAIAGCGPAFVYMFAEAMSDAGIKNGITNAKALKYAAQTIMGSAKLILDSGKHPAVLKNEVCSPGGSTIEGVAKLENDGFRASIINAVQVATDRTKYLGK